MYSSTQKYKVAETWCTLGMKFLKHLSQHKESYEEQVCYKVKEVKRDTIRVIQKF